MRSILFKNKFGILYFLVRIPRSDLPHAVFLHYNPLDHPAKRTKGIRRNNLPPFRRHKLFRDEQTMNTLIRFLPEHLQQNQLPESLGGVLLSVVSACTEINAKVRLGALAGVLGMAGTGNIQGEDQKKLDVIANNIMIDALKANPAVAGLASEEEDTFVNADENGRYLVLFDPLDGSSNIDINISVGTIFSILEKPEGELKTESFLQAGRCQLAAGYVLYGPQTQLVFTFGHGVYMFTLNAENEFVLTKENTGKHQRIRHQYVQPPPLVSSRTTIHRRALGRQNRYARQKLQYALGSQYGCRNPPHTDARRRVHVSAR